MEDGSSESELSLTMFTLMDERTGLEGMTGSEAFRLKGVVGGRATEREARRVNLDANTMSTELRAGNGAEGWLLEERIWLKRNLFC